MSLWFVPAAFSLDQAEIVIFLTLPIFSHSRIFRIKKKREILFLVGWCRDLAEKAENASRCWAMIETPRQWSKPPARPVQWRHLGLSRRLLIFIHLSLAQFAHSQNGWKDNIHLERGLLLIENITVVFDSHTVQRFRLNWRLLYFWIGYLGRLL